MYLRRGTSTRYLANLGRGMMAGAKKIFTGSRTRCRPSWMPCRLRRRKSSEPDGNGYQNLIAQPGTSCPIEFRLIQMSLCVANNSGSRTGLLGGFVIVFVVDERV